MKALAIAAHPDDETLGCGGTLLGHVASGDTVHWLLVTAAHGPIFSEAQIQQQAAQVAAVAREYPFASLDWLKFPATTLESLPLNELVTALREVLVRVRPEVVYMPHRSDVHSDHRVVYQAVQAVLKSFYQRSLGVRRMLACEVLSETDAAPATPENAFLPNVYVDVSRSFDRKLDLMKMYKTELQRYPLPREPSAITALARFRGASVGVKYAEAFMLVRELL